MSDTTLIHDVPLVDALSERYLAYALSTIMSRSLPDVRDGLKPVHRRLLYAMRQLKIEPGGPFKKSSQTVGDVMGKYHPHGDQAIYDALVRLAQDFSMRYPLIEGQGNFGNIDGDNAAAMRYTEARLSTVAARLLAAIDEDVVDFKSTYNGEGQEPVVLPAAFPNLLANGAQGVAVGMATSIPPHNVAELCQALRYLLDHPDASVDKVVEFVQGPDFPTGGILVESGETILSAYKSGKGSFRLRAKWAVEKGEKGGYNIIVSEIPYQIQKARLIERIADLLLAKKLPLLADIRDESDEQVRLVLEPKNRNVEPEILMESLFQSSDLDIRVQLNLNVLDADQTPRLMSLKDALQAFLDHRYVVLRRRTHTRLNKIADRLEVLSGYLIAFANLDEVIRIIREEDEPKKELMRRFSMTDMQAETVLNMRLRSLRKLEEVSLREEQKKLQEEQKQLQALIADESVQKKALKKEIKDIEKDFSLSSDQGRRKTDIGSTPKHVEVPSEAFIDREPITLILSEKGWIRALKGQGLVLEDVRYKEGDQAFLSLEVMTTDKVLVAATNGKFYTLQADKLPGGRGFGEPLRLMIDMPNDHDVLGIFPYKAAQRFLLASADGRGFVINSDDVLALTKSGKQVMNPGPGKEMSICQPITGDHIAVVGENRKILVYPVQDIPEMTRGKGVILQKYKAGGMSDVCTFYLEDGLKWSSGKGGKTKVEKNLGPWMGKRATAGRLAPMGFSRANKFFI